MVWEKTNQNFVDQEIFCEYLVLYVRNNRGKKEQFTNFVLFFCQNLVFQWLICSMERSKGGWQGHGTLSRLCGFPKHQLSEFFHSEGCYLHFLSSSPSFNNIQATSFPFKQMFNGILAFKRKGRLDEPLSVGRTKVIPYILMVKFRRAAYSILLNISAFKISRVVF